ncbi:hypothetical protein N0V93_006263 [Gnomoniopsis smithogilvyi]|uniref:Uncharacterized protein n=1 Tax=Gnomoniopsis smithogilvyi TaxID=1191159 RepID=A0A9W9CUB9_9PEZI|nr:hypothetical protein N0V93_006263 [Gnomoniopsis smithogilvyi]
MKINTFLSTLLNVNLVLGGRWTQKRRETRAANARRFPEAFAPEHVPRLASNGTARIHSSRPLSVIDVAEKAIESRNNESHTTYSANWAGALLVGSGYTAVTGTITVPTPTGANAATQSAGAAWVGIDGGTCSQAILQTGIDWYVTNGQATYDAWYEWYPDYSYDFSGITINAGDSIRMTVLASATTNGAAHIENLTTGKAVSQAMTVSSAAALCETNAEWIIEDFESCDSSGNCPQVPFANFGSVTFTQSLAVQGGTTVTPATGSGLQVLDLYQNSQVLTNCAVSGETVACTYV